MPPSMSADGHWHLIHDFDAGSVNHRCSVSGLTKRKGDPGVFRSPGLWDEYVGYHDISAYAIGQAARMLGYLPPDEAEKLRDEITDLEVRLAASYKHAFKKAQDAVKMAGIRASKEDI